MVGVPESAHQLSSATTDDLPNRAIDSTHLSKCALLRFSMANHTIVPNAIHMIQPVAPGPVAKLYSRKPTKPLMVSERDVLSRGPDLRLLYLCQDCLVVRLY